MSFISKLFRFVTMRVAEGMVVIFLIAFMPNLPPYCKISDSRTITPSMLLEGKLALNNKLDNVEIWHKGHLHGPEAFADYNGELYASLHSGDIVKLTGNHITPIVKFGKSCRGIYQERICGRPLGIEFDKDGFLIAADAYYGIFRVNVHTGEKVQLVSLNVQIEGKEPKLPNSVAVASNGDIFWTDSSTDFILQDGMMDMLADGSGRLIHYNAKTKENKVLIDNLLFANGVALSADEEFVIVAETGASAIHRYYLKGPKKGTRDVFMDGLPGIPDNLKRDGKEGFFVPLILARDKDHPMPSQFLAPWPFIRKFISRIFGLAEFGFNLIHQVYPNEYTERAIHFIGHFSSFPLLLSKRVTILHVSKDGEVLQSFHTTNGKIGAICEIHIFKELVYLGSPFNDYIGRIPLKHLGLESYAKKKEVPTITISPQLETLPTTTTHKSTTITQKPMTTEKPKTITTAQKSTMTTTEKPIMTTTKLTAAVTPKPTATTTTATTTTPKPTTTTGKPTIVVPKPTTTSRPITTITTENPASTKQTTTEKPTSTKPTTTVKKTTVEKPTPSTQKIASIPKKEPSPKETKEQKSKFKENPEALLTKMETKTSTVAKDPHKLAANVETKDAKRTV